MTLNKENYRDNPNLKRSGIVVNYTSHQLQEFIKCSQDPVYFIDSYCKIITLDGGLVPFKLWPFQKNLIDTIHNNRFTIVKLPRQVGKALDIETPILTSKGFKKLKEIQKNDIIYGPDGNETKVKFITEIMNDRPCYNVKFSNGDILIADEEHLWEVNKHQGTKNQILTTKQILTNLETGTENKFYIEITKPLNFNKKQLPIDPYTLGVWLGDGGTYDGRITCSESDLNFYKTRFDMCPTISKSKRNPNVRGFSIIKLNSKLKENNLIKNKHIPIDYMLSSYDQRLELIKGLMDTDGSITTHNGVCQFYQKNEQIIDAFRTILASLGIKSTKKEKIIKKYPDNIYYTVNFTPIGIDIFKLPRKLQIQQSFNHNHPKLSRLYIHSIEKIKSIPVRCLEVDNENHLFLAGTTLIPTHNTQSTIAYMLWVILFTDAQNILIAANKRQVAEDILEKLKIAYENMPIWLQQGVIEWNKGNIELENGSKIRATSTTSGAARSGTYNCIILDEFAHIQARMANDFYQSVYPVISSGTKSKIIIISTPKGMNLFYKFWMDALGKKNKFIPFEVSWRDVPGRDDNWYEETISNIGEDRFAVEFESCDYNTNIEIDYMGITRNITIGELYTTI